MKILIVGDPHAADGYDNDRFSWLGHFVADEQPDTIVCMGDFADMKSLSSYDKGRRSAEGKRYNEDIAAVVDAQDKMFSPIDAMNTRRREAKKAQYKPRKIMCIGNHEQRIERATQADPSLHGTISYDDLKYSDYGWEVHDYQVPVIVAGIAFCHNFPTGVSGNPVSGENIARALLSKNFMSSVVGHIHTLDRAKRSRPDRATLFGLSAGCYVHYDFVEGWNRATERMWYRGVVVLDGVSQGYFQHYREVSMKTLEEKYG